MPEPQTLVIVVQGTMIGNARETRGLTRGRLPDPSRQHIAHQRFIDVARADACAFDGGLMAMAPSSGAELLASSP